MGALSINGIPALRTPFEPLVPEVLHVRNTNRYHRPTAETEEEFTRFLLDDLEQTIEAAGPETVAMVIMEPVQNAGGAFTPPEGYWRGVRELCDRYEILLCADEVITGFGRVGAWFASERYDIRPDLVTCAKGLSSAYASIGAVVATDRVMEPFLDGARMYTHGITFGGHPVQAAIALKNLEIMKRERIVEHVGERSRTTCATRSRSCSSCRSSATCAGTGFFYALELVKDKETRETFSDEECERAAARIPHAADVRRRPDLPRGRPRRPRDPDLAAAHRGPGRVRRARRDPRRGADRGLGANRDPAFLPARRRRGGSRRRSPRRRGGRAGAAARGLSSRPTSRSSAAATRVSGPR